jgi:small subunit ribosomal protein S12e
MSDAGDEIQVEAPEVEVTAEAPKGKLSVEEALQVSFPSRFFRSTTK